MLRNDPSGIGPAGASPSDNDIYRVLVDSITDYAVFMLDPLGIVTSWNAGAARSKGYQAADIVGRHFACFYTPEDRDAGLPARALATAARCGKFEGEGWRVRRDGSRFWASVVVHPILTERGDLAGFSKVTRDISEAKAARDAIGAANQALQRMNEVLGRNEARFRQVVEATPNGILMVDTAGAIRMVNAQAERMFGYTRTELIGRPVETLLPADTRGRHAALRQGFFAAPATRAMGARTLLSGLRKDGSAVPVEVSLTPVDTDDGTMVLAAVVDVSERLEFEAQLRQAQKMEVLGRLAAGVSHDFNNILQVILGGTDILKDEASLSPAAESFLDAVESAALRGAYLTHHLLSYTRKQTLHPKPVDPCKVVEKLRVMLVRTLPSNIAVTIRAPAASGLVRVDRAQLETALMNLAINASHAMPDGGTLLVEVGFTLSSTTGGLPGVLKPGRYAVVAVEDNGVGMSPEVLACAFDPFFTTKGAEGTGLGLAMVHGFSRQSGGDVRATSAPGKGTRFEIWLPEDLGVEPEPAAPAPRAALRTGSVLLVDDSRDVLVTVGAFLRRGGYAVEHAEGGHQALKLLEAGRRFDALVTDYMMPGLSGVELIKRARDLQPGLPALIISGYAEVTDFMTGLPNATLLQKPFQRNEFLATLGSLVGCDAGMATATVTAARWANSS